MCLTEFDEEKFINTLLQEGEEKGIEKGIIKSIVKMLTKGRTVEEIVEFCGYEKEFVQSVADGMTTIN